MARKWKPITDEEFRRQYEAAKHAPPGEDELGPRAIAAHYDADTERLVVDLDNGSMFAVPVALIQGIAGAAPEDIAAVEVTPDGDLHWEKLDADHHTTFLVRGFFGNDRWMSEIGRTLGSRTSEAKARASRENGRKGGRPRKAG